MNVGPDAYGNIPPESLQILSELGASIRMVSRSTYEIDTSHLDSTEVSNELSRQMRASYYFLGALLGRFGSGQVAMPGGCNFGVRPIDQHVKGFTTLGAKVVVEGGFIHASTENGRLKGANIYLDVVSVGATMNIMLAGVLAEGMTNRVICVRDDQIVNVDIDEGLAMKKTLNAEEFEVMTVMTGV